MNKTHIPVYVFLCLFILTFPVCRIWANPETAMAVDPPISTVNVGDTFSVNVNVTNVANLTCWQLDLYYRNTVLNCTAAVLGPFLATGGGTYNITTITNNFNSTHGHLLAYSSLLGLTEHVDGSGVILTVTFKAVSGGNTKLTLANTILGDEKIPPLPIPHTDYGGTVNIVGGAHDVAVTDVTPYKTVIFQGFCGNITVTVADLGGYTETFDVTAYVNATAISTITGVTLASGDSAIQTIVWNTTGFVKGNYNISAYASPVAGEANTANNNGTGGWVLVSMLGDLSGTIPGVPDGKVDIKDVSLVAKNFGKQVPPAPSNCDVTGMNPGVPDGKIDIRDVSLVAKHFGEFAH